MLASPSGPHVILLGNHKGGSGKSTLAMHVAIALLKS
jgi:chromosome partitioning protein